MAIAGIEGAIFCKLKNFLQRVSLAVSVGSLVWIAIDRFVAVVLPIKVHLSHFVEISCLCDSFYLDTSNGGELFRFVHE